MNEYTIETPAEARIVLDGILCAMQKELASAVAANRDGFVEDIIPHLGNHTKLGNIADALSEAVKEGERATPFRIRYEDIAEDSRWDSALIISNRLDWVDGAIKSAAKRIALDRLNRSIERLEAERERITAA